MFSQPQERLFSLSTAGNNVRTSLTCARVLAASLALLLAIKSRALSNQQAKKAGVIQLGLAAWLWAALETQRIPLPTRR